MLELTSGYCQPLEMTTFDAEGADQMVCQWNIPMYSLCEHHLLPFTGYAHIGYIPNERIIGLSKFKRLVDRYARRFQVQERLTRQIANELESLISPRGVIVIVEAEHLCMTMRGVQAPGTLTTTSAVTGDFLDPKEGSREEFMSLLNRNRKGER
jgi:GTP cyclohydrolase I